MMAGWLRKLTEIDGNRCQIVTEIASQPWSIGRGCWQIEAEIAAEGVGMLQKKRKKKSPPQGGRDEEGVG